MLALGSDTEVLRREGQRLEAMFGHDAGNGWAYNHGAHVIPSARVPLHALLTTTCPAHYLPDSLRAPSSLHCAHSSYGRALLWEALSKMRLYQEKLLLTMGETFEAPSMREVEDELEAEVQTITNS